MLKAIGTVAYLGGIPALLEEFCFSLAQLVQYNAESVCDYGQYVHLDRAKTSDHAPARNMLVERFLGDWLLMLDTDHQFEPDLLSRMLRRMDQFGVDVLTGLYRFKYSPLGGPVLYTEFGDMMAPIARIECKSEDPYLVKVHSAGAGCLLVRRKVYDQILATGDEPFDRIGKLSEDHSFFTRCYQLGIGVYCDPAIECHHLRTIPVTAADHDLRDFTIFEPKPIDAIGVDGELIEVSASNYWGE